MLITGKLVCVSIGALTLAGSALLKMPGPTGHGLLAGPGNEVSQSASSEIGAIYREASAEISPRIQSLPDTASAFVRSNATTARLQFEGMANAFPSLSAAAASLPGTATYLMKGGVPVVIQDSSSEANRLADKMPVVKAWKSNIEHLANLHPALSGGK